MAREEGQPMPGDGRFPEDPEFNVDSEQMVEAISAARNMGRVMAAYRDQLTLEGFTEAQVLPMLVAATAAQFGGGR